MTAFQLDRVRIAEVVAAADRRRAPHRAGWRASGSLCAQTMPEIIREAARVHGDTRLHFWSEERPRVATLAEAHADGMRIASALQSLGYRAGDVVVLQLPHWFEWMSFFIGALEIGLIIVPVIHIYGEAELGFVLRQTRARALVSPARWGKIDFAARFDAVGALPDLEHVFIVGGGEFPVPGLPWDVLLGHAGVPATPAALTPQDICAIFYTSGTTATPKGVLHSHESLGSRVANGERRWSVAQSRPTLGSMPAGHIAGILALLRPLFTGEALTMMDRWDADAAVDLIKRDGIVMAPFAPMQLATLLDAAGDAPIGSLFNIRCGGAGVPPDLILRAEAAGLRASRTYGCTEHPSIASCFDGEPLDKRANTDGRVSIGSSVRLFDEQGREVGTDARGEIIVIGPETFSGYVDPADEDGVFTSDGAFRTGDIATIDAEGFLTIVDRAKDIIIRGGETLSPREIEEVLLRHDAVAEAAVVGIPDPLYGERVAAFVVVAPGRTLDLPAVATLFQTSGFARQKTPERLILVDALPRTPLGKVRKAELRQGVENVAGE